jgi:amino acid transporter
MGTTESAPQLIRALKLRDLVLLNLVAVLGLRHLSTSAAAGPVTLVLWVLAALLFFLPQGLAVIELSSRFPHAGGVYDWTKRALGERHGFLCGWCYWINNVLYYPNLLMAAAVIATYAIGQGETGLKDNLTYVTLTTLVSLWVAAALNIVGVGTGKWLQNAGGFGTYVCGALVMLVGVYAWVTQPAANALSAAELLPKRADYDSLNLWISIAFAYAGLELSATMGEEVENPKRNLPLSIFIAAPLIGLLYLLGTGAVLWLIPRGEINLVAGFLQTIQVGLAHISPALGWLVLVCALLYTVGNIGGVGAWLVGPARVAFAIGLDRYFPPAFARIHTPYVAILVEALLATVLLLVFVAGKGTQVGQVYLILLSAQVLIYFIPYLYLFIVFIIHRRRAGVGEGVMAAPGGLLGVWIFGLCGFGVTLFAMVLTMIPPGGASWWEFSGKALAGVVGLLLLGWVLYWRANRRGRAFSI